MGRRREMTAKSCSSTFGKSKDYLTLSGADVAQHYPPHCPQEKARDTVGDSGRNNNPLGEPLSIREVALLIGCSAWNVRQQLLPRGLPHFRSRPNGKLIFYRNQVIRWLLRQQRGGIPE